MVRNISYVWLDDLELDVDPSEFKSITFGDAHMTLCTQRQLIDEVGESAIKALSVIKDDVLIALRG